MGLFDLFGTILTNKANSAQASRQMEFQANMSNTAHQREVQDLIAAGLNPVLSAGGSGASAPAGAQATMQNPLAGDDPITSAMQMMLLKKQLKKADVDIANTEADTKARNAAAVLTGAQGQSAKVAAGVDQWMADRGIQIGERLLKSLGVGAESLSSAKKLIPHKKPAINFKFGGKK